MRRRALSDLAMRIALPLVLVSSMASQTVRADAGGDAYLEVREEVGKFRENTAQRRFRHHYERYIERLQKIAKEHPKSDRADDALYVAAQLYDELYQVSLVGRDLEAAIAAYDAMAKAYPKSNLADDALFRAATLRLEKLGDRDGARALLSRVVAMKPAGDMHGQARELLARLPPSSTPSERTAPRETATAPVAERTRVTDIGDILKKVEDELKTSEAAANPTTTSPAPAPSAAATSTGDDASAGDGPLVVVIERPSARVLPARRVNAIQHAREGDQSVVKVRLSDAVEVKRGAIPASGDAPRRVFYELSPVKLGKQALKPLDVNDGVIRRVRVGQFTDDTARLVIELEGEAEPVVTAKKRPFELSIAVGGRAPASVVESAPSSDAELEEKMAAAEVKTRLGKSGAPGGISLSEQMGLKIRKVVIDAGHGGHDTGAIGPTGLKEKDVTLAIAKRVKRRLEESIPDLEVILTRDDDRFLELGERTAIANGVGADLFISIHANANPSRKVHGVETYYLNITSDRYAIRLAQRENAETNGDVTISDLEFILADLAMKSNVDDSIRLGRHVQGSLVGRLRQDHNDVQDLGLKHALFFVLLGSRMPAILVETSFISNRVEEKRLGSDKYQEAVADGVVRGVQRFLEERQAYNRP